MTLAEQFKSACDFDEKLYEVTHRPLTFREFESGAAEIDFYTKTLLDGEKRAIEKLRPLILAAAQVVGAAEKPYLEFSFQDLQHAIFRLREVLGE